MGRLHSSCNAHVSLARGLIYCPETQMIYGNARILMSASPSPHVYSLNELQHWADVLLKIQRAYTSWRPGQWVLIRPEEVLPGMLGDGVLPKGGKLCIAPYA
jgi:hypothetical protein